MSKFEDTLDIAKAVCGFVFSHSEEIPAVVRALIFGISDTCLTVRCTGAGIGLEAMEQDIPALFGRMMAKGAAELSAVSFTDGLALRFECKGKDTSFSEREDPAPEGVLFRVAMTKGEDKFHVDREMFRDVLSGVFAANEAAPAPETVTVFLNGSRIDLHSTGQT